LEFLGRVHQAVQIAQHEEPVFLDGPVGSKPTTIPDAFLNVKGTAHMLFV
jgi:hypothetical protein